jgi:simple sugar transport system ATP-binding protein
MSDSFLTLTSLSKTFNAVQALIDFDFSIRQGEIHCLVGQNGCGKSTLIKTITGVLKPDGGNPNTSIIINGKDMTHHTPASSMKEGIQVIYQDLSLFPNLTVAENIEVNSRIESHSLFINWKKLHEQAQKALERINAQIPLEKRVSELSIAQQQLVAISRALTNNAKLLIMDEPTASLGRKDVNNLINIIRELKKEGISVLFIGHKLDEVMSIADRISVMRDGRLIKTFEDTTGVTPKTIIPLMTSGKLNEERMSTKALSRTPLLEVRGLKKQNEFEQIDFDLYPGEVLGVIGLVGSGRTELFSSIFGLNNPYEGEIFIEGKKAHIETAKQAIEHGIAFVPEDRLTEGLFMTKSIEQNINVTVLDDILNKQGLIDSDKAQSHADYWIDNLKIKTPSGKEPANSLSGGNQQRIVLSKWMATKPKILILDGPTIGVDVGAKDEIHKLIHRLAQETGIGIIMITDEISEVYQYSSRIMMIKEGKIVWQAESDKTSEKEIQANLEGRIA